MANCRSERYFFDDGWPRQADIMQDAAAALEVFETLAKEAYSQRPGSRGR
jgi:hypothetical protein